MANTPTTPASVASLLDDEYIEALANKEAKAGYWETAAVLRDYVRIRGENAQLKARLEAVMKECAKHISMRCKIRCKIAEDGMPKSLNGKPCYRCNVCDLTPEELAQTGAATDILRAARGEGGAK